MRLDVTIPALKYLARAEDGVARTKLPVGSGDDLLEFSVREGPCACVCRRVDLEQLRNLGEAVVDRGRKHSAKGLSALLLRRSRIPLIDAQFSSPGRAEQSVKQLLRNATRQGESNLYVIGVGRKIFQALWEMADESGGARMSEEGTDLLDLLPDRPVPKDLLRKFVGNSAAARLVRQLVLIAAEQDDPVLVQGGTGTGKEVVARAVHDFSERRVQAFVPVNCGAIPGELLESELFGHRRGAFTGAVASKEGLWKAAQGGTIFLDEIGDLRLDHQVKILRAIDLGMVRPVGSDRETKVDARVIAATNRDLWAMVQAGQFREDLYYRLRSFLVYTPPLREHPEDIALLARFFWERICRESKSTLPVAILDALATYRWPGNARELKAVLSNLHALFGWDRLGVRHLQSVFELEGHAVPSLAVPSVKGISAPAASSQKIDPRVMESLRHLRQVDEVLQAVKVTLEPLLEEDFEDGWLGMGLQRRLGELELLCGRPEDLWNPASLQAVKEMKRALAKIAGHLRSDIPAAQRLWKEDGPTKWKAASEVVFVSIQDLLVN